MEPPGPSNTAHAERTLAEWHQERTPQRLSERLRALLDRPDEHSGVRDELRAWSGGRAVGEVLLDEHLGIVSLEFDAVLPSTARTLSVRAGDGFAELLGAIADSLDASMWIAEEFPEPGRLMLSFFFGTAVRDKRGVVLRIVAVPDGRGVRLFVASDLSLYRRGPANAGTPVALTGVQAGA